MRTTTMPTSQELESQILILQRRLEEAETRAIQAERATEKKTVEMEIRNAAAVVGANPAAMEDLLDRALKSGDWRTNSKGQLMRMVEGVPEVDTDGNYVTPRAWLKSLKPTAPYLFIDAADGGEKDTVERNPWLSQHWNMSDQGKLYAKDKVKAEQLAAAAGSRVGATRPTR
jgi:hypothetical protein